MGRPPKKPPGKADPLIDRMDKLSNALMDKAEIVDVTLQAALDVHKQVASWLAIKNRLTDLDETPGGLDELRRRLRSAETPPRRGAAREPGKGGDHFNAARHALHSRGIRYPDGEGGAALDAIKRRIPGSDPGDADGAGDDSEC